LVQCHGRGCTPGPPTASWGYRPDAFCGYRARAVAGLSMAGGPSVTQRMAGVVGGGEPAKLLCAADAALHGGKHRGGPLGTDCDAVQRARCRLAHPQERPMRSSHCLVRADPTALLAQTVLLAQTGQAPRINRSRATDRPQRSDTRWTRDTSREWSPRYPSACPFPPTDQDRVRRGAGGTGGATGSRRYHRFPRAQRAASQRRALRPAFLAVPPGPRGGET
jgi:hypothetical protein